MNTIFKYNANAKYSAKDLRSGYNSNNFSLLGVYLDDLMMYLARPLSSCQISLRIIT